MVMIPQIQESTEPQGKIEIMRRGQANASDFGGQVAEGQGQLARVIAGEASGLHEQQVTDDVTAVHGNLMKARADWTQNLQDREAGAKAGDPNFAPGVAKDMTDFFQKGAASATTRQGQTAWNRGAAEMTGQFVEKAIAIQAKLTGEAAVNDVNNMVTSGSAAAGTDETQYGPVMSQIHQAIYDTDGIYGKIPAPERDRLWQHVQQTISFTASKGFAQRHPEAVMTPEAVSEYAPFAALLKQYAAPGGHLNLSAEAVAKAPEVAPAAAAQGVNPNVILAMTDHPGTEAQPPKELIPSFATLLNTYGGDYTKALTAYWSGSAAVDSSMRINGSAWFQNLPAEAQQYAQTIMDNAGLNPTPTPAQVQGQGVPTGTGQPIQNATVPGFNLLSYEQQSAITHEASAVMHTRLEMAKAAEMEQQKLKAQAADTEVKGAYNKIIDGKFSGADMRAIENSPNTSAAQVREVASWRLSYAREARDNAENRTNPAAFNKILDTIFKATEDPNIDPTSVDSVIKSQFGQRIISSRESLHLLEINSQLQNNSAFGRQFKELMRQADRVIQRNPIASAMPEVANDAKYAFEAAVAAAIATERAKGPNASLKPLFDPNDKVNFLGRSEYIDSFVGDPGTAMKDKAEKVKREGGAVKDKAENVKREGGAVKEGTVLKGHRFKGGDPSKKENWEKVAEAAATDANVEYPVYGS